MDAKIHLVTMNLGKIIQKDNIPSPQDHMKALIFLHHRNNEGLKGEYLIINDPLILYNDLIKMYDQQKTIILPRAWYYWLHLRLQYFKFVSDYNPALFEITFKLKLYGKKGNYLWIIWRKGDDMFETTFTTFHVSNILL